MKYVIFSRPADPMPIAVLFNAPLQHKELAQLMAGGGFSPLSAGFVDEQGRAYGSSVSLGLASQESDTELIRLVSKVTRGVSAF